MNNIVKRFLGENKGLLVAVITLGVLTAFSASALMFTAGYLISKSATHPYNILLVYIPVLLTRCFGIARPVFRYAQRLASHQWVLKMTSKLRLRLYNQVEKSGIFYSETFKSGKLLSMLTEDIGQLQNLYLRTVFPGLVALSLYFICVVMAGFVSLKLALILFVLIGNLQFLFPALTLAFQGQALVRRKRLRTSLYERITDNIFGAGDFVISGQKQEFVGNFSQEQEQLNVLEDYLQKQGRTRKLWLEAVFLLVVLGVIIFSGEFFMDMDDKNWIAAFVLAVFPLADTFVPLSTSTLEYAAHKKSIDDLEALPEPVSTDQYKVLSEQERLSLEQSNNLPLNITDLTFSYEDGKQLLEGLNLAVSKGQKLCILGRSGSGKSTLLKLIEGQLKAASGQVEIFGENMEAVDLGQSRLVGVLNQTPWIFNTSIFNNLRLGNSQLTEEGCVQLLKLVGLEEKIKSLPEGIHTVADEGGKNFSGGEAQRIALARILAMDAPIILLDEPTVGLDPITENQLLEMIFALLKDKTIVWVTHHLNGINHMDKVVYLRDGKVSFEGSPQQLLLENVFFKKLYAVDMGIKE